MQFSYHLATLSNSVHGLFALDLPAAIVLLISIVSGLLMVIAFRYTSDQKAIHIAKDHLKAHLLAVRLFQDQLPVVLRSYVRIMIGTARYLRLAFKPLLFAAIPFTFLIIQLDHSLGSMPISSGQSFLVKAHADSVEALNDLALQLPPELFTTAPAVHIPVDNEVVWRVVAAKNGDYDLNIVTGGQTFAKQVIVSTGLPRLSLFRLLRKHFFERMILSAEPALPQNSPVQSIEVVYPARTIEFATFEWNWIWLFFVVSLVAGFFFKSVLGIEV